MAQNVRIVTKEREHEISITDLGLTQASTDRNIIEAAGKFLDANLQNYIVTRNGDNIMVSPTPIFG
jgi:hypothetical protein